MRDHKRSGNQEILKKTVLDQKLKNSTERYRLSTTEGKSDKISYLEVLVKVENETISNLQL